MDIMKVKSVEEITPEVIEFINGILTKKKSLEYIIKTYSKSINVEDAVVVEQAKNEFLKLLNEAGYKKNRNNRRYELRSKEQNKEKDTPNFNVDDTNKEDVKIPRKRKTKKEVEEEKDRLEHPYGNMKDDELMKTIFNHAKNTNYKTAVKKPVGIYVYNTVAEKFKYLEEAYFLINNNIIMDTLINIFIEKHNNEYTEGFEQELLKILHTEKKNKKQVTYVLSEDTNKKLEQLINEKFEHYSKTEFINLVMLSCSERFIIENEKESTVE